MILYLFYLIEIFGFKLLFICKILLYMNLKFMILSLVVMIILKNFFGRKFFG